MIRSSLSSHGFVITRRYNTIKHPVSSNIGAIHFFTNDGRTQKRINSKSHDLFPNTFSQLELSPAISPLQNRIIMGSMHCGLEPHSIPSFFTKTSSEHHLEELCEYYAERARGLVSLIVTGGISPNRAGWVGPFSAKLTNENELNKHKIITEAVHNENDGNTKICMQILHAGRYAMHPFSVAPSRLKAPINPFTPFEMSPSRIRSTIKDYVQCSVLAKKAGYDGVEIMGSEGYLIHQFLSKKTNIRKDEWGGSDFSNRMRFAIEIVKQIKEAVGDDFIIIYRLSLLDLMDEISGSDWEEVKIMAMALQDAGIHILNTGIGWHEARVPTIATCVPRAAFVETTAQKLKSNDILDIPVVASNRINDPHVIENLLSSSNPPDLISMARPFLADPKFVQKMYNQDTNEINTCIGCNQACLDHVFVGRVASCLVNPKAGHELEFKRKENRTRTKQNIAVIGAGPSGMAFSVTAAELGHHVTLMDAQDEIGGQFHMAKQIPGKEEFYETLRYFKTMISKKWKDSIDLKLGMKVEAEDLLNNKHKSFDKIVIATGVKPRVPAIKGIDHPNVLTYVQVLKDKVKVGEKVAIIGAGGIGFDVAEFLLHNSEKKSHNDSKGNNHSSPANDVNKQDFLNYWDIDPFNESRGGLKPSKHKVSKPERKITILQRKKGKLGSNLGKTTGWIHRTQLKKGNVDMIGGCNYEEIDKNGNLHVTITKRDSKSEKKVLEVDNVVICAGQESLFDLETEIINHDNKAISAKDIFRIGGSKYAGELDAKRAIDMGVRLAYDIDLKNAKVVNDDERVKGDEERMIDVFSKVLGQ